MCELGPLLLVGAYRKQGRTCIKCCESDCDLENDLNISFQGHLMYICLLLTFLYIYLIYCLLNVFFYIKFAMSRAVISSLLHMLPYLHATIQCGTFTVIVNDISLGALVIKMSVVIQRQFAWLTCRCRRLD